jgi:hypothetical protein
MFKENKYGDKYLTIRGWIAIAVGVFLSLLCVIGMIWGAGDF